MKLVLGSFALIALMIAATTPAKAIEPDGPHIDFAQRNAEAWASEDAEIDAKLATLEERFGKKPNIIYILTDDVGWGELGWQGGGKHRGTPSDELDKMAFEGMRFWSGYAEPSCTPTRIAINTGRHPARTGLLTVLWPGQEDGLSPEEVTVAEVLSEVGYSTAMWGKWHLGDLPEHAPENQGYDYAYYGLFNGAPDYWQASFENKSGTLPFADFPGNEAYLEGTGIDLSIGGYVGRKGEGRTPIEGAAGTLSPERQEAFENESIAQITQYVKDHANDENPFFIYWVSYAQQIAPSQEFIDAPGVDKNNRQASFMAMHNKHVRQLLDTLKAEGIAENTLVVWISDNGPLDFIARLAALVPKPRVNLTRFHGVFAPNSRYRARVTKARRGRGGRPARTLNSKDDPTPSERRAAMTWAQRLKRVFGIDIETCRECGGAVRIIACIDDPAVIEKILTHLDAKTTQADASQRPPCRAPPQRGRLH